MTTPRDWPIATGKMDMHELYDRYAGCYDRDRGRSLMEAPYLERIATGLQTGAEVLDLGCGCGEPIGRWFIEHGFRLTGVDAAPAMLEFCRARFPVQAWIHQDMRTLDLDRRFGAVLAWDSFFHLTAEDQRRMFAVFERHCAPGGFLLFTSGPHAGVAIGDFYGHELFHASLAAEEYRRLLGRHGFAVLAHRIEDPDCGRHTVWLARAGGGVSP